MTAWTSTTAIADGRERFHRDRTINTALTPPKAKEFDIALRESQHSRDSGNWIDLTLCVWLQKIYGRRRDLFPQG